MFGKKPGHFWGKKRKFPRRVMVCNLYQQDQMTTLVLIWKSLANGNLLKRKKAYEGLTKNATQLEFTRKRSRRWVTRGKRPTAKAVAAMQGRLAPDTSLDSTLPHPTNLSPFQTTTGRRDVRNEETERMRGQRGRQMDDGLERTTTSPRPVDMVRWRDDDQ